MASCKTPNNHISYVMDRHKKYSTSGEGKLASMKYMADSFDVAAVQNLFPMYCTLNSPPWGALGCTENRHNNKIQTKTKLLPYSSNCAWLQPDLCLIFQPIIVPNYYRSMTRAFLWSVRAFVWMVFNYACFSMSMIAPSDSVKHKGEQILWKHLRSSCGCALLYFFDWLSRAELSAHINFFF